MDACEKPMYFVVLEISGKKQKQERHTKTGYIALFTVNTPYPNLEN